MIWVTVVDDMFKCKRQQICEWMDESMSVNLEVIILVMTSAHSQI